MYTLGINAAYHDPAACLVRDGRVIAAAEDERFTHVKHGKRPVPFAAWELPFHAIDYCLGAAGIDLTDIDHVAYSYDPFLLLGRHRDDASIPIPLRQIGPAPEWESPWDPLFLSSIVNAPGQLLDGAPHHLQSRFRDARSRSRFRWHFVAHHLAHAASAFHASPFERAAVMTLDGRGERATTGYAVGQGTELEWLGQVQMPHSLGILYEQVTSYLGFLHSSDEYKVMALASYGRPRYVSEFASMIHLGPEGRYTIDPPRLDERFGPPRLRGGPLDERHFDIAHSLQIVLEDTVIELARWLHGASGCQDLCMAGGVALNCVMNARLRDRGPFESIWVQPAAGDAGTALARRSGSTPESDRAPGATGRWITPSSAPSTARPRSRASCAGRRSPIDGWTTYPARWPRSWRPTRSSVGSRAGWSSAPGPWVHGASWPRPCTPRCRPGSTRSRTARTSARSLPSCWRKKQASGSRGRVSRRSCCSSSTFAPDKAERIPAVRHIDGTARIQTIRRDQNPVYYDLIKAFQARTGVPVLVNTSFNTRGEPIVCTPRDAVESFWTSPLDALVIGPFLLEKPAGGMPQR